MELSLPTKLITPFGQLASHYAMNESLPVAERARDERESALARRHRHGYNLPVISGTVSFLQNQVKLAALSEQQKLLQAN